MDPHQRLINKLFHPLIFLTLASSIAYTFLLHALIRMNCLPQVLFVRLQFPILVLFTQVSGLVSA